MALNENIADALVSHQIGLQRLSNATVRKIVALLTRADARIVERLMREDVSQLSRQRQEKLLSDLRRIIDSVYEDATGQLQIELEKLAEYEVEYQADMFRRLLPISFDTVTPGPNQIIAAVNSRPFQGRLLREWYGNLKETAQRRLRETVRQGIVEGQTIDQLVRVVRGTRAQGFADGILSIDKRNAEAVIRTAVNHTANRAREELYKRNKGLIKGYQMIATLDMRTSARCRAVDNAVAVADGYTKRDFGNDVRFLSDVPSFTNGSRPPFHINSVVAGTLIKTSRGLVPIEHVAVGDHVLTHEGRYQAVTTVMCKPKDTRTLSLVCDNGSSVSLSDDHPVLTLTRGWVAAGDVKVGDILAQDKEQLTEAPLTIGLSPEIPQAVLRDAHNIETSLREELISLGIFSTTAGVTSAINLKHCVADQEVSDVVSANELKGKRHANARQFLYDACLVSSGISRPSARLTAPYGCGVFSGAAGVLAGHSFGGSLGAFRRSFGVLLGPVFVANRTFNVFLTRFDRFLFGAHTNAVFLAGKIKRGFAKAKVTLNGPDGHAILPVARGDYVFDESSIKHGRSFSGWVASTVISTAETEYNGLMFNLSVEGDETYVAGGLVVHNCRTVSVPVVKSLRNVRGEGDAGARASMNGQVAGDMTYSAWLRRQPVSVQNEVLGEKKAQLFRRGEIDADRFIDRTGREYTLDELRERERAAWEKAGLDA